MHKCETRKGCPEKHISAGRDGCPLWRAATETNMATGERRDVSGCAPVVQERQMSELIRAVALLTAEQSAMRQGAQAQMVQMAERRLMAAAEAQEHARLGLDG